MSFVYAIIQHQAHYQDVYDELLEHIQQHFDNVESGIQGDAWIWVTEKGQKVAIDTFHSMQFEINSESPSELLENVLDVIQRKYEVKAYEQPIER